MPKLIDLEKIKPIEFLSVEMDGLDVVRYLNTLPTVDAVEVVRCKDCTVWKRREDGLINCPYCTDLKQDDDFCSRGERKNDG